MEKLAMFVPLAKADAAQRLVWGYIDETPDRAGEVMDYASSKPHFAEWSDGFAKATNGASVGNLRAQHGKIAAGKFEKVSFDDDAKRIELCARIVDDNEWAKVEQGVYTGFSPGGRYAKRWPDGAYRRYTALPSEISIVDLPCIPSATFTMIKADGVEEQVEFVLDKAYEPGNEATKIRAEEMAKSAGGNWKDHVQQARADLINENVSEVLAKMDREPAAIEGTDEPAAPALLDSLNAVMATADAVLVVGSDETVQAVTAAAVYASALGTDLLKADFDLVVAPPSPEAVSLIGDDLAKSILAVEAIRAAIAPRLEKGLYDLADVVSSLRSFAWITQSVTDEACWENDNSPLPQMAVDILKALKAFLIAMVEEEVAEMLVRLKADAGDDVALVIEGEGMELATQIVDLVKADTIRMEKAGARNSKPDAARIQLIHDKAGELGASCAKDDNALGKAAELEEVNQQLTKAVTDALPRFEALTGQLENLRAARETDRELMVKMQQQIEELGGQPALTKIEAAAIKSKEDDNLSKSDDASLPTSAIEATRTLPGPDRARELERIAMTAKHHRA